MGERDARRTGIAERLWRTCEAGYELGRGGQSGTFKEPYVLEWITGSLKLSGCKTGALPPCRNQQYL